MFAAILIALDKLERYDAGIANDLKACRSLLEFHTSKTRDFLERTECPYSLSTSCELNWPPFSII